MTALEARKLAEDEMKAGKNSEVHRFAGLVGNRRQYRRAEKS